MRTNTILGIKNFLSALILILLFSCFPQKEDENTELNGKWIDISYSDTQAPLLYDFKGENIYTTYLTGEISKRKYEHLKNEILISSDTNQNYLHKYSIISSNQDSIILSDSQDALKKLVPFKSVNALSVPERNLRRALVNEYWNLSYDAEQEMWGSLEFFKNGKYLFTYDSGELTNQLVFDWGVHKVDSLTVILLKDFLPNLLFIDNLSENGINGTLFSTNGKNKKVYLDRAKYDTAISALKNMLPGYWELKSSTESNEVPVAMEFEREEGYMGYYMNTKDGDVLSMGSWDLSKSGKAVVLDELKNGNSSAIIILGLYDGDQLTILYQGEELKYIKTRMPL